MLDVYIAMFLVTFLNGHITQAKLDVGFYSFLVYCLVSIGFSQALEMQWKASSAHLGERAVPLLAGEVAHSACAAVGDLPRLGLHTTVAAVAYLVLGLGMLVGDLLRLRVMFEGLVVDSVCASAAESLRGGLVNTLPRAALGLLLSALVIVVPWLCSLLVLCDAFCCHSDGSRRGLRVAIHALQHWATPDVFALAAAVFLVLAQSPQMLTIVPDDQAGVPSFFVLLASGFCFAGLRFTLHSAQSPSLGRLALAILTFVTVCAVLSDGSPTRATEVANVSSVGAVCNESRRVLNALVAHLPTSVGQCNSSEAEEAPEPCIDTGKPLYSQEKLGFQVAVPWVSGINSLTVDACSGRFGQMDTCNKKTGRQCRYLPCLAHGFIGREKADCVEGECLCPAGTCADASGTCIRSFVNVASEESAEGVAQCSSETGLGGARTAEGGPASAPVASAPLPPAPAPHRRRRPRGATLRTPHGPRHQPAAC